MRTAHLTVAALSALSLASGCGPLDDPNAPAGVVQTADALETSIHESSLLMSVVRALDAPLSVSGALDRATLQIRDFYGSACVQGATRVGANSLRVDLLDCTGRIGLRNVTGEIVYTFELDPGGVRVTMRLGATGPIRIGASRITELDTTALFRFNGLEHAVILERSVYTATGARGQYVHRDTTLQADPTPVQATWNLAVGGCFALNGSWRVRVGPSASHARTVHVSVNHYRRCGALCPALADEAVVVSDEAPGDAGASVYTVSFLGGSVARWTSTNPSASGVVTLTCMN